MTIKPWIEAMRLRTLPVSLAGVLAGAGFVRLLGHLNTAVFILCLVFAVLAQIASNFANEYFDFKSGLDRSGRVGPRRGVTEGDITPEAMKKATYATLTAACLAGLSLIYWGGWIVLLFGILIAAGVLAYSAGPYPLSRHCLGEIAVIVFFGLAPVCLTFYIMTGTLDNYVWAGALSVGLMGANVLLVNNIRDIKDDRSVGKHTLVAVMGRKFGSFLYFINGWIAVWLTGSVWLWIGGAWLLVPSAYILFHTVLWYKIDIISRRVAKNPEEARKLNPFLGLTAMLMATYALFFAIAA